MLTLRSRMKLYLTLLKKAKSHQRIKQMKRMNMKQNPLNPLPILGFFRGVILWYPTWQHILARMPSQMSMGDVPCCHNPETFPVLIIPISGLIRKMAIPANALPPPQVEPGEADAGQPPLGFADVKVVVGAGAVGLVAELALELQQVLLHIELEGGDLDPTPLALASPAIRSMEIFKGIDLGVEVLVGFHPQNRRDI